VISGAQVARQREGDARERAALEAVLSTNLYVPSKEPYIPRKEPYIPSKKP